MSAIGKIDFRADNTQFITRISSPPTNVMQQKAPNNVATTPSKNTSGSDKTLKAAVYVSSAVALASLCVTGVATRRMSKAVAKLSEFNRNVSDEIAGLKNAANARLGFNDEVNTNHAGRLGSLEQRIGRAEGQINGLSATKGAVRAISNFQHVNLNGVDMQLASVRVPLSGPKAEAMRSRLRAEAASRILGAVERNTDIPASPTIRFVTSECDPWFRTGGMGVVPKELYSNIAAIMNTRQKGTLLIDAPLYRGALSNGTHYYTRPVVDAKGVATGEMEYFKVYWQDGKKIEKKMTGIKPIEEMNLDVYTEDAIVKERVGVYMSDAVDLPVNFELLKSRLTKETIDAIKAAIKESGKYVDDAEEPFLTVVKNSETGLLEAKIKAKTVFYDSPKFDLAGGKGIYNNDSHNAQETERMIYFSKFFAEHIMGRAYSRNPLGADLIIGNDWQTGAIAAMIRQLPIARGAYTEHPDLYERISKIPMAAIIHNAGLSGQAWDKQAKYLNIMFGEHAAEIASNSWMINTTRNGVGGLDAKLHNALMTSTSINPQMMLLSFADDIIPVSVKYADEVATEAFGGAVHEIFALRARKGRFDDKAYIDFIAQNNGLNKDLITGPTAHGITNGSDRVNNILTKAAARRTEAALGLKPGTFKTIDECDSVEEWHNHNKAEALRKVIADMQDPSNPMKIKMIEQSDISFLLNPVTGEVSTDTPVFSIAGRIAEQKGLDIFAEAIKKFYQNYKGKDFPVFYVQGNGQEEYFNAVLKVKKELLSTPGMEEAGRRIIVADLFSEPGRYDCCRLMSDFFDMSSWFEPCGLAHKDAANFSGAIPIVNKVGGLTDGLKSYMPGVNASEQTGNAIFAADFMPKLRREAEALEFNATHYAQAMREGNEIFYSDKATFNRMLKNSYEADYSWLFPSGPADAYMERFIDLGVFKPFLREIYEHSA